MDYQLKPDLKNCYDKPKEYKFCENGACVLNNEYCPCNDNFFQCRSNKLCIHPSFVCNGVNDCGNNRDELGCESIDDSIHEEPGVCNLSVGAVVGISIGVVVFVTICVLVIVYCVHRKQKLRSIRNTSSLEPLRIKIKNSSTDVTSSSGSDVNKRNSEYNKVPLDDSFGPFNDVLCTSTPKPDARRQIIHNEPMPPILMLKPA